MLVMSAKHMNKNAAGKEADFYLYFCLQSNVKHGMVNILHQNIMCTKYFSIMSECGDTIVPSFLDLCVCFSACLK